MRPSVHFLYECMYVCFSYDFFLFAHLFTNNLSFFLCALSIFCNMQIYLIFYFTKTLHLKAHKNVYKTHLWCCFLILIFYLCLKKVLIWYQISLCMYSTYSKKNYKYISKYYKYYEYIFYENSVFFTFILIINERSILYK